MSSPGESHPVQIFIHDIQLLLDNVCGQLDRATQSEVELWGENKMLRDKLAAAQAEIERWEGACFLASEGGDHCVAAVLGRWLWR